MKVIVLGTLAVAAGSALSWAPVTELQARPVMLAQTQAPSVRTVEPRAAEPRIAEPATSGQLDPEVAVVAVKRALSDLREPSAKTINVSTHASTVVLTGEASSGAEAARIVSAAERAAGGVRVMSQLEVDSSTDAATPAASTQLVRDVESALRRDPRTADLDVSVSIDGQQTISLHGLVPSRESRAAAQAVAQQTRGVNRIDNRLVTAGQ